MKAKMVKLPWSYRWSSVHADIKGKDPLGVVDAQKRLDIRGIDRRFLHAKKHTRLLEIAFSTLDSKQVARLLWRFRQVSKHV